MLNILKKARENKYAIGAFNVSNLEQIKAIAAAAAKAQSPLIIATSEGESDFIGKRQIRALIDVYKKETNLPLFLHLDHGKNLEIIKEAVEAGYDSIHFDGSELSFEENIEKTKEIVEFCRKNKVQNIEGELGYLRGKSIIQEKVEVKEEDLTKPEQAEEFIKETGITSLAVAIGNIHGIVKGGNPHLCLDRLREIKDKVSDKVFLVLHGSSGTPEQDIKEAIKIGIVKINVNTDLRVAYSQALRQSLQDNPKEVVPYKIMPPVVATVQKVVEERIKLFGSEDKA